MAFAQAMDAAAGPLDRARAALLSLALRAGLGPVLERRDRRLAVIATLGVIVALGLTVVAPIALFVVGPVLLGVPHVASDVRYLVTRRGLPGPVVAGTAIACAALIVLRVVVETGVAGGLLRLELALAAAWILAAMVAGALAGRSPARLLLALPVLGVATIAALRSPVLARYVFLHAHNLVAIGIWIALFRRSARRRGRTDLAAIVAPLAVAAATALLLSGATLRWMYLHGAWHAFGFDLGTWPAGSAPGLAPALSGLPSPPQYIFSSSPSITPPGSADPAGRRPRRGHAHLPHEAFRALGAGLRRPSAWRVIALGMIAVAGGALADARRARDLYVSLAMFHGYLELAMLGFFLVRGRGLSASPAPSLLLEAPAEGAAA